jgi:hypothetical protein
MVWRSCSTTKFELAPITRMRSAGIWGCRLTDSSKRSATRVTV